MKHFILNEFMAVSLSTFGNKIPTYKQQASIGTKYFSLIRRYYELNKILEEGDKSINSSIFCTKLEQIYIDTKVFCEQLKRYSDYAEIKYGRINKTIAKLRQDVNNEKLNLERKMKSLAPIENEL